MGAMIALLRAVNVGGAGTIAMARLRAFCEDEGLARVRSLLNTGNLAFETELQPLALEARLEAAARERLGLATDFFVRRLSDWREVLGANPFPREGEDDPGHLVLIALKGAPDAAKLASLEASIGGRERIAPVRDVLYITYPDGIGRSKLTLPRIEKALGLRGTGRNWNTARKLAELAES